MNKKGGEKLLSIWWFFVLIIVGVGVVVGVIMHFGAEVNTKGLEARILSDKILNCVSERGFLKEKVLEKDFDILGECGLEEKVFGQGSLFYINLTIFEGGAVVNSFFEGDGALERDCPISLSKKVDAASFPGCVRLARFFGEKEVRLLAASNNRGGKISVRDKSFGEANG